MWHDGGWGGWLMMGITMIVFWGAVTALVVWLVKGGASKQASSGQDRPSALEIRDERFARGEIDREEYEARRTVLLSRGAVVDAYTPLGYIRGPVVPDSGRWGACTATR